MRLKKSEIEQLQNVSRELKRLAKMQDCSFKDMDNIPNDKLRLWLQWFIYEAIKIDKIVGIDENKDALLLRLL